MTILMLVENICINVIMLLILYIRYKIYKGTEMEGYHNNILYVYIYAIIIFIITSIASGPPYILFPVVPLVGAGLISFFL